MKKIKSVEEALRWGNIIFEYVNSMQEPIAWCEANGIVYRQFRSWRQSLNRTYVKDIPDYKAYFAITDYSKQQAIYWQNIIRHQQESRLNRRDYCRANNINIDIFMRWSQRELEGELDKVINRDEQLIEIIHRDKINVNYVIWYPWIMKCRNQTELNQPDFCKENHLRYQAFKFYCHTLFPSGVKISHRQEKRTPQEIVKLLTDCASSTMSVQDWLRENKIPKSTYDMWRRKAKNGEYDSFVDDREKLFRQHADTLLQTETTWLNICKEFCKSSLTQLEFAKHHDIPYGSFKRYYYKFIEEGKLVCRDKITVREAFENSSVIIKLGEEEIKIYDEETRIALMKFLEEHKVIGDIDE